MPLKTIKPLKKFQHAIVAVDTVIFALHGGALEVLLLQLVRSPFIDKWAVPGGLVLPDENLEQAVTRHLNSKTGLKKVYHEQLYTFGDVNRDRRGRVVSVAYLSLLPYPSGVLRTTEDYKAIQWFKVQNLPPLAYDHQTIIAQALERLRSKLSYTNIAAQLLSDRFTLGELQAAYELVLGQSLDKRNFRKKILSLDILAETKDRTKGAFRPAQLYRFKSKKVKIVEIL